MDEQKFIKSCGNFIDSQLILLNDIYNRCLRLVGALVTFKVVLQVLKSELETKHEISEVYDDTKPPMQELSGGAFAMESKLIGEISDIKDPEEQTKKVLELLNQRWPYFYHNLKLVIDLSTASLVQLKRAERIVSEEGLEISMMTGDETPSDPATLEKLNQLIASVVTLKQSLKNATKDSFEDMALALKLLVIVLPSLKNESVLFENKDIIVLIFRAMSKHFQFIFKIVEEVVVILEKGNELPELLNFTL
jgi:hypothetical protein